MAFDFSKLNFINRLDARARIFVLAGVVVGIVVLIYIATRFFSDGSNTTGPSKVASAPAIQSVQGGNLTPEYQRAVMQASQQAAQQAQMSGGSAVPTLINVGMQQTPSNQCVVCTEQTPNVKNNLDDMVRKGELSPDVAASLQQLADKNISVDEYANELARLVKEGKLTPEQARLLLEQYKKQHGNKLLDDSARLMDEKIKNGQLSLDAANQLLMAQKSGASASEYAAQLQEMVKQGKISPELAQQLLNQYAQQRKNEIIQKSIAVLEQMARNGELIPEVLKNLTDLENRMVPIDFFTAELKKMTDAGKITPGVAAKVLEEFKQQKADIGGSDTVNQLLQKAEAAAYQEISDLLKAGKMTQDVANNLVSMIQRNVSFDEFAATINQFVKQGKMTPEIAKLKMADYQEVKGLRDMMQRLTALQGNNASSDDYANELKRDVQAGILTPEQAAQLMQEYLASTARAANLPVGTASTKQFAALQRAAAESDIAQQGPVPASEFADAQQQAVQESAQDRATRIAAMMTAMSGQAQQLVAAWQTTPMQHKEGTPPAPKGGAGAGTTTTTTTSTGGGTAVASALAKGPVLIKGGTILFAVLDTAVNSDYPDSPVLATVVEGPFKGAKLMGKLITTKSVSGQLDRVMLTFTVMNRDEWPASKAVTAYAIDPDTAKTVLASNVDYHYMQRFGAIMATSFMQGYGEALLSSGGTTTTGIFGTSSVNPALSPNQKIFSALGQMGKTVGDATKNYVNIPPTVKVDSGVGLGILFMNDLTS